jgi:Protein of unknown function (DUF992)
MRRTLVLRSAKTLIAATLLAWLAVISWAAQTSAAEKGVKAGYLRCDVAGSVSFIFGSSRNLTCTYETSGTHRLDGYTGKIKQYGLDIGYLKKGVIIWAVVAPTNDVGPGALAGDYGGITADLAAGYGVGANALLGGYKKSIALQPLSVEGVEGLNIAAGIVGLTLRAK